MKERRPRWQRRLAAATRTSPCRCCGLFSPGDGESPLHCRQPKVFEEVFPDDPGWPGRLDSNLVPLFYVYDRPSASWRSSLCLPIGLALFLIVNGVQPVRFLAAGDRGLTVKLGTGSRKWSGCDSCLIAKNTNV